MIISRKYALKLLREGKATLGAVINQDNRNYLSLDRLDLQRVDHYPVAPADYHTGVIGRVGARVVRL